MHLHAYSLMAHDFLLSLQVFEKLKQKVDRKGHFKVIALELFGDPLLFFQGHALSVGVFMKLLLRSRIKFYG